jgi:hypothetical protein
MELRCFKFRDSRRVDVVHTMTRFTSDTALRETLHQYIKPARLTTTIATMASTIRAENILNPVSTRVATNTAARENPRDRNVSSQMVRY